MAKKSRRARRQQSARRPVASPPIEAKPELQPSTTPEEEYPAAAPTSRKQEVDFVAEYRYVVDDLRSMAIIALAMVVVLIGLSLVIQ